MTPAGVIRIASVPGGHAYIRQLELSAAQIAVLADPVVPGAPPGRWWPPEMLRAGWIAEHADAFDVMHIHFGVESFSISALSDALAALDRAGRPLVYTVHDLEHPQLGDQARHQAQLDRLIDRAAAVITLTPGAAEEIHRRWGRTATVIPHGPMADALGPAADALRLAPVNERAALRVGVHLRDLRPGIDGPGVVAALSRALAELTRAGIAVVGRVVMFDHVRDARAASAIEAMVRHCPQLQLTRRPRLSDAELIADLARLDVSLLPYRHGTHSGWVELCWDLALPVVGAPVGYIAQQHDDVGWFTAYDPGDPGTLSAALSARAAPLTLARQRRERAATMTVRRSERRRQAPGLARAHRQVYDRVLGLQATRRRVGSDPAHNVVETEAS